jgi:hypothetical protein
VDCQVASVNPQAEGSNVKFTEIDAAARDFFYRGDYLAPDSLPKGIGSDIPAHNAESNCAEKAKQEKKIQ